MGQESNICPIPKKACIVNATFFKNSISRNPNVEPKILEIWVQPTIEPTFQKKIKRFLKIGFKRWKNRTKNGVFSSTDFGYLPALTSLLTYIFRNYIFLRTQNRWKPDCKRLRTSIFPWFKNFGENPILASDGLKWPRRSDLRSSGPPKSRSLSKFWIMSRPRKMLPYMIFGYHK